MIRKPISRPVIATLTFLMAWFFASLPLDKVLMAKQKSDAEILRLQPSAFTELPASIVGALAKRNCLIPQVEPWIAGPHNVISGQFQKSGQTDWAILCSIDGTSSLLVFWNGSAADVETLAGSRSPDRNYLQDTGGGRLGFSRLIGAVSKEIVLDRHGGLESPGIDHDGIDNAFVGKASTLFYWHKGEWLRLQGTD